MRQPITTAWNSAGSTPATTCARSWPWLRSTPPMPWRVPSPTASPFRHSAPSTSPTSWRPGLGRCRNPDQLTRRHDLLDIDIAPPDLNAYEVNDHDPE